MLEVQSTQNSATHQQSVPAIDTIFLDMDGTLLDLHYDNYFWLHCIIHAYADKHSMTREAAEALLVEKFAQKRGTLLWYCVDYWAEQLALDIMALKADINDKIQFRPGTEAFIQAAKAQGFRLVLATNAHRKVLNLKLQQLDFAHYFDALYASHDFGVAKEHPEFWPRLQAAYPFDKHRAMFVDDSVAVLDSAKAFGIAQPIIVSQPDSTAAPRPAETLGGYPAVNTLDGLFDYLPPSPVTQKTAVSDNSASKK